MIPEPDVAPAGARRPSALRTVRAAFVSFSRLPLGGHPYVAAEFGRAAAHLPLVGAVIGAAAAGVFSSARAVGLGGLTTGAACVACTLWLTGAFHEDGLADSADGLGGAHGGKRALEIMKDSRIGSYGAAALGLSLLWRSSAIGELAASEWFALIYVHCAARAVPVTLLAALPYAGDTTQTRSPGLYGSGRMQALCALGWVAAASALGVALGTLSLEAALLIPLLLAAVALGCGRLFHGRVGGITGDLLGAAEQAAEVAAWLGWLALRSARAA